MIRNDVVQKSSTGSVPMLLQPYWTGGGGAAWADSSTEGWSEALLKLWLDVCRMTIGRCMEVVVCNPDWTQTWWVARGDQHIAGGVRGVRGVPEALRRQWSRRAWKVPRKSHGKTQKDQSHLWSLEVLTATCWMPQFGHDYPQRQENVCHYTFEIMHIYIYLYALYGIIPITCKLWTSRWISIYLSTYPPTYLSIYPSIHPPIHPSTHQTIHPSTHPSIHLSDLSIYLSTYLSVCLAI